MFHNTLQKSLKPSVRFLCHLSSNNCRTSCCQNLKAIAKYVNTEVKDLSCMKVKKVMQYYRVPKEDIWRVTMVMDMIELKWNNLEIDVIKDQVEDLDALIEDLCRS